MENAARLARARALHNADKRRLLEAHGRLVPSRATAAHMVQLLGELGCEVPTSDGMELHMQALRAVQRREDGAKIASGAPSGSERQLVPVMPSLPVPAPIQTGAVDPSIVTQLLQRITQLENMGTVHTGRAPTSNDGLDLSVLTAPSQGTTTAAHTPVEHVSRDYSRDVSVAGKLTRCILDLDYVDLAFFSLANMAVSQHSSAATARLLPISDSKEWVEAWRHAEQRIVQYHPHLASTLGEYFDRIVRMFLFYREDTVIALDAIHRQRMASHREKAYGALETDISAMILVKLPQQKDKARATDSVNSGTRNNASSGTSRKRTAPDGCPPNTCWSYWNKGSCLRGSTCPFSHTQPGANASNKRTKQ